jgi:hypothetical protein
MVSNIELNEALKNNLDFLYIKNLLLSMDSFVLKDKLAQNELIRFSVVLHEALRRAASEAITKQKEDQAVDLSSIKITILEELEKAGEFFMMYDMQNFFPVDEFLNKLFSQS